MGIDVHALNFLLYAKRKKSLGTTITIGRQSIHIPEKVVKRLVQTKATYRNQAYCEELLREYFNASDVQSIDNSDYENATYVHDMNEPLPRDLWGKFDTVIDAGCSEHMFNIPQALRNFSQLCKLGGQIIHVVPANNFCGHGFWQFSPELFFSLYSAKNGYSETEVFLGDLTDTLTWYRVHEPKDGERVNVYTSTALYVLVRTVLSRLDFAHSNVQQSDYVYRWNNGTSSSEQNPTHTYVKQIIKKFPPLYQLLSPLRSIWKQIRSESRLNARNPGLTVVPVKTLTT